MPLYYGKSKKEKIQDKAFEESGGDLVSSFHHSGSYHRYFEGYAESRIPADNARGYKIVRTYVSSFYERNMSDTQWRAQKIFSVLACVTGWVLFFSAATQNEAVCNHVSYVSVAGLVVIFSVFAEFVALMQTLFRPRKMTIRAKKEDSVWLMVWSIVFAAATVITAGMVLIFMISQQYWSMQECICLLLYLLAAVPMIFLAVLEHRTGYRTIQNNAQPAGEDYIMIRG